MYKFKFKRHGKIFYKTLLAEGHKLSVDIDRMDVFCKDKVISIGKWSECDLLLENDYLQQQKK